jgi:hypothetical protein
MSRAFGETYAQVFVSVSVWFLIVTQFAVHSSLLLAGLIDYHRRLWLSQRLSAMLTTHVSSWRSLAQGMHFCPPVDSTAALNFSNWLALRRVIQNHGLSFFLRIQVYTTVWVLIVVFGLISALILLTLTEDNRAKDLMIFMVVLTLIVLFIVSHSLHLGSQINSQFNEHSMILQQLRVSLQERITSTLRPAAAGLHYHRTECHVGYVWLENEKDEDELNRFMCGATAAANAADAAVAAAAAVTAVGDSSKESDEHADMESQPLLSSTSSSSMQVTDINDSSSNSNSNSKNASNSSINDRNQCADNLARLVSKNDGPVSPHQLTHQVISAEFNTGDQQQQQHHQQQQQQMKPKTTTVSTSSSEKQQKSSIQHERDERQREVARLQLDLAKAQDALEMIGLVSTSVKQESFPVYLCGFAVDTNSVRVLISVVGVILGLVIRVVVFGN